MSYTWISQALLNVGATGNAVLASAYTATPVQMITLGTYSHALSRLMEPELD